MLSLPWKLKNYPKNTAEDDENTLNTLILILACSTSNIYMHHSSWDTELLFQIFKKLICKLSKYGLLEYRVSMGSK